MQTEIEELQELLTLLKQARNDILLSGGAKSVKKGDFYATYTSLSELNDEIRRTREKILILEVNSD